MSAGMMENPNHTATHRVDGTRMQGKQDHKITFIVDAGMFLLPC